MKKEYIKPEIITVDILPESMLALSNPSEGMDNNETPGTDDDFNAISEAQRKLYMSDPVHPMKAGYREWWGPEMERQLLQYLGF